MGLVDAEARVKPGDRVTGHGSPAVGMDRLWRDSAVRLDGVLDEFPGQDAGFRRPRLPVDYLTGVDVNDHVQVEPCSPGGAFQFRDVPPPDLAGAVGHQL